LPLTSHDVPNAVKAIHSIQNTGLYLSKRWNLSPEKSYNAIKPIDSNMIYATCSIYFISRLFLFCCMPVAFCKKEKRYQSERYKKQGRKSIMYIISNGVKRQMKNGTAICAVIIGWIHGNPESKTASKGRHYMI